MTVKSELLHLVRRITETIDLPRIRRVYIPEPRPHENRHTEFGVVELDDGATGLYYAWLGDSQQGMRERFEPDRLPGNSPVDLISLLDSDTDADRSLGLAALNAVTCSIYRRGGYRPETTDDSMGSLAIENPDHPGMVGYFPSLIDRLRKRGIKVTVIEKKARFASTGDNLIRITDDLSELRHCNKILVTASTLLNDSIDEVLERCRDARITVIVGPTAGFFPDPLFRRGVTALGGTEVPDATATIRDLENDAGLSGSTRKYLIQRKDYPGIDALLSRLTV